MVKHVDSFMFTLDYSGRLVIWLPSVKDGRMCSLRGYSKVLQVPNKPTWAEVINSNLYLTYRYHVKSSITGKVASLSVLEVYDVMGQEARLIAEHEWEEAAPGQPGRVSSACIVPCHPHAIFLGHE
jgi:hypothetical protein